MSAQTTLTPADFAAKWRGVTTTEKAGSQSQFIDLCRMLGEPTPHEADPTGESYAIEKRVTKKAGPPVDPGLVFVGGYSRCSSVGIQACR